MGYIYMITAKEAKAKAEKAKEVMGERELLYIEKVIIKAASEGEETAWFEKPISKSVIKKLTELGYEVSSRSLHYLDGATGQGYYVSWSD